MKYDVKSMKAEEFINDGEILETLKYAEEHKNDLELIDKILEKAAKRKGLSHREASVLLACENEEKIKEIYDLAEQIKKDFYGNRIFLWKQTQNQTTIRSSSERRVRVKHAIACCLISARRTRET